MRRIPHRAWCCLSRWLFALAGAASLLPAWSAPLNDDFTSAIILTGIDVDVTGSNAGATSQAGEPFHAGALGGASVWWSWTSPSNAVIEVSTSGSSLDTLLAVYQGEGIGDLHAVASNDDEPGGGTTVTSLLRFTAHPGVSYHIAVDGFQGDTGNIKLSLELLPPPANDAFASAIPLAGNHVTTSGDNTVATAEPGEPEHAFQEGGRSVWWTWSAPAFGGYEISTEGSSFNTLLAVYEGADLTSLVLVAGDNDISGTNLASRVRFTAETNVLYRIVVDGWEMEEGTIALGIRALPPPLNDAFANAEAVSGLVWQTMGSNIGATREPGEPIHAGNEGGASVWWRWTAPEDGFFELTTGGSPLNTLLGVYVGDALPALTQVVANDNEPGVLQGTSRLILAAVVDTQYHIAVDGFDGRQGDVVLRLQQIHPPANDAFAQAGVVSGWRGTLEADNLEATKEAGEPNHSGNSGGASVWWQWSAPADGVMSLSTLGSSFDTVLAVYVGNAVDALTRVTSNDDNPDGGTFTSRVQFEANAGTIYWVVVDGFRGAQGQVALTWEGTPDVPPAPSSFQEARRLEGGQVGWTLVVTPGVLHHIEISTNLIHWGTLLVTNPVSSEVEVRLSPGTRGFLRAVGY